jgi:hypothetical protein
VIDLTASVQHVEAIQASVCGSGLPCELVVFDEDTHMLLLSLPEMFRRMLESLDRYSQ